MRIAQGRFDPRNQSQRQAGSRRHPRDGRNHGSRDPCCRRIRHCFRSGVAGGVRSLGSVQIPTVASRNLFGGDQDRLIALELNKRKGPIAMATGPFSFVDACALTRPSKPSARPSARRRRPRPCGSPTASSGPAPRRCTAPDAACSCRSRAPSGPWS